MRDGIVFEIFLSLTGSEWSDLPLLDIGGFTYNGGFGPPFLCDCDDCFGIHSRSCYKIRLVGYTFISGDGDFVSCNSCSNSSRRRSFLLIPILVMKQCNFIPESVSPSQILAGIPFNVTILSVLSTVILIGRNIVYADGRLFFVSCRAFAMASHHAVAIWVTTAFPRYFFCSSCDPMST